jgi:hypothetical protein
VVLNKITSVTQNIFEADTLVKMYTANIELNSLHKQSSGYSPSIMSEMVEEHGLAKELTANVT